MKTPLQGIYFIYLHTIIIIVIIINFYYIKEKINKLFRVVVLLDI